MPETAVFDHYEVFTRDDGSLFKFIATPQYGTEELYDLTTDHGEVRNLVKEQPALAALLREKVHAYRDEGP